MRMFKVANSTTKLTHFILQVSFYIPENIRKPRRLLSYRNQSIDLLRKSVDWFLYDNGDLFFVIIWLGLIVKFNFLI